MIVADDVVVAVRLGVSVEVGEDVMGIEVADNEATALCVYVGERVIDAVSVGVSGRLIVGVCSENGKTLKSDPAVSKSTTNNNNHPKVRFGLNPRTRKVSMTHANANAR